MRWLRPGPWPTAVPPVFLGLAAAGLAWTTFDLFRLAMANADFPWRDGLVAVMHGGLWQTAVIIAKGASALFACLAFKGIERELGARWTGRKWRAGGAARSHSRNRRLCPFPHGP